MLCTKKDLNFLVDNTLQKNKNDITAIYFFSFVHTNQERKISCSVV